MERPRKTFLQDERQRRLQAQRKRSWESDKNRHRLEFETKLTPEEKLKNAHQKLLTYVKDASPLQRKIFEIETAFQTLIAIKYKTDSDLIGMTKKINETEELKEQLIQFRKNDASGYLEYWKAILDITSDNDEQQLKFASALAKIYLEIKAESQQSQTPPGK